MRYTESIINELFNMKFPYALASQKKNIGIYNWKKQFAGVGRSVHEGIWRRTQDKQNASQSDWKKDGDKRWRVVHFLDTYGIQASKTKSHLLLKGSYLKINHSLPETEALNLYKRYTTAIQRNKKAKIVSLDDKKTVCKIGELNITLRLLKTKKEKERFIVPVPEKYIIVDVEIIGGEARISSAKKMYPWNIINKGFRIPLKKGKPTYTLSTEQIKKYVPFQVELGCGASVEAGIYPLSYLHDIYQTKNMETGKFIFGNDDSLFEEIIRNPQGFYKKATKIMSQSWMCSKKTSFYPWLKHAHETGLAVGPIITNNYDGLVSRFGLRELYVRKFSDQFLVPKINFHPKAKALLVVGSHADRRLVQQAARKKGLKVIFVDPETYIDERGKVFSYPIESPQDGDIVFKMTAEEFSKKFKL